MQVWFFPTPTLVLILYFYFAITECSMIGQNGVAATRPGMRFGSVDRSNASETRRVSKQYISNIIGLFSLQRFVPQTQSATDHERPHVYGGTVISRMPYNIAVNQDRYQRIARPFSPWLDLEPSIEREGTMQEDGLTTIQVNGSKSTFQISYAPGTSTHIRSAFENSAREWSEVFECSGVIIRTRVTWIDFVQKEEFPDRALGGTGLIFVSGNTQGAYFLREDTTYPAALAACIQGVDLSPREQAHFEVYINANVSWHFDVSVPVPDTKVDLATVALHEFAHGIFLAGVIDSTSGGQAAFLPGEDLPSQFDQFLATESGFGVVSSCNTSESLFKAITQKTLRFLDPSPERTEFQLFSPSKYRSGTSVYHLDPEELTRDCARLGLNISDHKECSDLMTPSILPGYMQRNIGQNTLILLNSLVSKGRRLEAGPCNTDAAVVPNIQTIVAASIMGACLFVFVLAIRRWLISRQADIKNVMKCIQNIPFGLQRLNRGAAIPQSIFGAQIRESSANNSDET